MVELYSVFMIAEHLFVLYIAVGRMILRSNNHAAKKNEGGAYTMGRCKRSVELFFVLFSCGQVVKGRVVELYSVSMIFSWYL